MILPIELQQIICNYTYDLKDTIKFCYLSSEHYEFILVKNLFDRPSEQLKRLTQKVIDQPRYKYLEKLNVKNNPNIKQIDHLLQLEELNCESSFCGIGIETVKQLILNQKIKKIKKLIANGNGKMRNVENLDIETVICDQMRINFNHPFKEIYWTNRLRQVELSN